jgi:hypothetical protein
MTTKDDSYTPKHAKRSKAEEFCDNTALPIGIITGGIIGLIVVAVILL